jgi:hypothetical protein
VATPRPEKIRPVGQPATPTMDLVFVERISESKRTLLILHQKYTRADGTFYYREVRRISAEKLERINREGGATLEECAG